MNPWLSRALAVLAAFAICWLGAIAWWRETRHMPGTGDVLAYLVLAPLLLLAALWVGRKLLAARGAGTASSATAVTASASEAPASAAQIAPLVALAGALRMPHGDDAAQLGAALAARKANLALDPELTNDSGYPILSGRIPDLDPRAQQDAMRDWLAAHHPQADFGDEQWRALALGEAVAAELAGALAAHPALPPYLEALRARKPAAPLPALQLVALLPPEWQDAERAAATDWLRQGVARTWPAERIVLAADLPADGPAAIHQLATRAGDERQPFLCLLLACDSRIGAASTEQWSQQGLLFDSEHPDGRIPGEGAAGLLLADAAEGALLAPDRPVLLHPPFEARRSVSLDARPRAEAGLLVQLAGAGLEADAVGVVSADGDGRAARMAELLGALNTALPELDPASQVLAVGAACGDAGAATTLAALALAREQAAAGAGPALCISNLDPFRRSAALLAQASAPAAATTPPSLQPRPSL